MPRTKAEQVDSRPAVIHRRLAAIFCADVAAYAKLMKADEAGTLCLLNAYREVIDRQITQHSGRIANTAGDSILAEFPSAVDATRCAMGIQERVAALNEDVPEERRVVFRIGIHVGEVFKKGGDLLGDGVNIAARMEKLALPGLVCLSEITHDYVRKSLPLRFQDIGLQNIKSLDKPIRAFLSVPYSGPLSRMLPAVHQHDEFSLARRFHRALTAAMLEVTEPEGLTPVEPTVFSSLHDHPVIDERQLAERIGLDLAHTHRMLKHLELLGLVCWVRGGDPRRLRLFSLTPAGHDLFTRLSPAILAVRDRVMAPLSEAERGVLHALLARVISAYELSHSQSFRGL
jgi:class 3 adenylate cyclase/DNA-binding MarR family transcriptional regulator